MPLQTRLKWIRWIQNGSPQITVKNISKTKTFEEIDLYLYSLECFRRRLERRNEVMIWYFYSSAYQIISNSYRSNISFSFLKNVE